MVQHVGCEAGGPATQVLFTKMWRCRGILLPFLGVPIVASFSSALLRITPISIPMKMEQRLFNALFFILGDFSTGFTDLLHHLLCFDL